MLKPWERGNLRIRCHFLHLHFVVNINACSSSNGSVVPRMVVKMDALAQVDQRQLADFLNNSLQNGTLGNYEVDPRSVRIEGMASLHSKSNCHLT